MIYITLNSHLNSSESNNLNTSNSDNVTGNSNLTHINVKNDSPFNTIITFQKRKYKDSSFSINDKIPYENNISREILYHQNS